MADAGAGLRWWRQHGNGSGGGATVVGGGSAAAAAPQQGGGGGQCGSRVAAIAWRCQWRRQRGGCSQLGSSVKGQRQRGVIGGSTAEGGAAATVVVAAACQKRGGGSGAGHRVGSATAAILAAAGDGGASGRSTASARGRRPAWQQRRQLGKSVALAVVAERWRHRQRQCGGGSSGHSQLGSGGSSLTETRLWRQQLTTMTTLR